MINDDNWLKTVFLPTVQKRGAAVIAARKLSSAMSAAKAASDHMRSIFCGTPSGNYIVQLNKLLIIYSSVGGAGKF